MSTGISTEPHRTPAAESIPLETAEVCCSPFDPALWEGKTHVWKDKLFMKEEVRQLFHVPIGFSTVITKAMRAIEDAHAMPDAKEFLMLAYDPSPWRSEIYLTVTRNVPGRTMATLSGTFSSAVFDGPYNHVPQWIEEMDARLAATGTRALKYYFHYAYCPRCAKQYGHNYCVAFAQIR